MERETANSMVSVIMPAYNAALHISESIESVIAQTYTNWELLIIDDGSEDDTAAFAKKFCASDVRIKYFYQLNGKQGKARNLGLKNALGDYVAFLDSDDIWLPEKLEIQLKLIREKNVDAVFCDGFVFKDSLLDATGYKNAGKGFFSATHGLEKMLAQNLIPTLTVVANSAALKAVNGFTENPKIPQAEDYHLWLKLLLSGYNFFGSDDELAAYRQHDASSSSSDKLAVRYVIEALEDLKHQFKERYHLIETYQKKWFIKYHYSTNAWDTTAYLKLVTKNCIYLNKKFFIGFLKAIYFLAGFNATRKLTVKLVNN